MSTLDDLLSEGEALVRPCRLLDTQGVGEIVGYWGGDRKDVSISGQAIRASEHIFTLDGGMFADVGIASNPSPVSLYNCTYTNGDEQLKLIDRTTIGFTDLSCSGEALYAETAISFPPIEALCLYGGAVVAEWMRSLGLQRHQYDAVMNEPLAQQYQDEFVRRSAFYGLRGAIIVGGWHFQWPEDDFFLPLEMRLLAITLRDAEPWYELWVSEAGNRSARKRIS